MYKLVGTPKSRAFRVLWMFEELGVEYEVLPAGPRSEEIKKLNPSGKVPVLLVDGEIIVDSVAIVQYLADVHGKFTYPAGTIERAKQDSFLQFAIDDMDAICWTASKHKFVFPEDKRVGEVQPSCEWDWDRSMEAFEHRLGNNTYVMGTDFTVPDLIIGHVAGWAKFCEFNWPEGKVTEYFERVRTRPAFTRAWEIREQY